jgi:hypothetical protein
MSLWLSSRQDRMKHRRREPVKKRPDCGFIGGAFFCFLKVWDEHVGMPFSARPANPKL